MHFEAALDIDRGSMQALQGLERICRLSRRFTELVQVLEQQVEAASNDDSARVAALVRLADVHDVTS